MSSDTGFPTGDGGAIGNQGATIKTSAVIDTKQAEALLTSGGPPALDNATKLIHEFLMKEPEFERVTYYRGRVRYPSNIRTYLRRSLTYCRDGRPPKATYISRSSVSSRTKLLRLMKRSSMIWDERLRRSE